MGRRLAAERHRHGRDVARETVGAAKTVCTAFAIPTGIPIEWAYIDRAYCGHDADKSRVFLSSQRSGLTPAI